MNKRLLLVFFSSLILLVIVYWNHFQNGFHFDDFHTIVDNPFVRKLSNIPLFFKDGSTFSVLPANQSYRPFTSLSLAIDYWLAGGYNPIYFHLSTFLWFLFQGYLLFLLLQTLYKQTFTISASIDYRLLSLLAVVLYSFHTAIAETINYIIARSEVLATVGVIGSLVLFIYYPKQRKYYFYLIPMIIGALVKPPALMFAPILAVYLLLFEEELSFLEIFRRKNLVKLKNIFFLFIPSLIAFLICYVFIQRMTPPTWSAGGTSKLLYILTQPAVTFHYFLTFFLPVALSADSDWHLVNGIADEKVWSGIFFILGLIYLMVYTSKQKELRIVSFGIAWFFIALIPTAFVPLSEVLNDHRIYFPFVGLTISLFGIITYHLNKVKNALVVQQWLLIPYIVCVSLLAYGTYTRNKVWNNEASLWKDVTEKSPENGRGWMNYGLTQMRAGQYGQALASFNKALVFNPNYSTLHVNLAILYNAMNQPEKAEAFFKKAIQLEPTYYKSYYFYADWLKNKNRYTEAIANVKQSIQLSPSNIDSRTLLATLYSLTGNADDMKKEADEILKYDPNDAHANNILKEKIIAKNENTLDINKIEDTKDISLLLNKSLELYNRTDYQGAIKVCEHILQLDPKNAKAYNNICAAYNELKQWDKAIAAGEKAVQLDPDFQMAKNNLNWAYKNRDLK